MPPKKRNFRSCAIENCQNDTLKFRTFTKFATEKAQNCRTLIKLEYSHLIPNQHQLCDHYYLLIVEPNRNYSKINEVFQNLQKTLPTGLVVTEENVSTLLWLMYMMQI